MRIIVFWLAVCTLARADDFTTWQKVKDEAVDLSIHLGYMSVSNIKVTTKRLPTEPEIVERVKKVHLALMDLLTSTKVETMPEPMINSIRYVFTLCSKVEWLDYYQGETELKNWIAIVGQQVGDQGWVNELSLEMGESHLNAWLQKKPVECARILDSFGVKYAGPGQKGADAWYFFQPVYESQLARVLWSHQELQARLDKFLSNEAIPVNRRADMAGTMARDLYGDGEPALGDHYMADFAAAHPEALKSIHFRHPWFYLSLFGLGDVQKAKSLLNDLETCGVNVDDPKPNDPAFAMTEAYYRQLPLSEDERQRQAFMQREESRKKKADREDP